MSAQSPASTPRPFSFQAIRCGRSTSPRPTSTTSIQRNAERGTARLHRNLEGQAGLGPGHGDGLPGRQTIVFEELFQLGCKKLIRVGTCGGLQPSHALGDLIVALTAVPADSTAMHLVGNEPHCPTAFGRLCTRPSTSRSTAAPTPRRADRVERPLLQPGRGQYERWSSRGVLAVEMEAAALFTVAALKRIEAACLLTVSDIVVEGEFKRISDDELRAAVDRMTRLALDVASRAAATHERDAIFLVNPASATTARPAKRWPKLRARAAELGLEGDVLFSERPGHLTELAARAAARGAAARRRGGDGTLNEVVNGYRRHRGGARGRSRSAPGRTSAAPTGSRPASTTRSGSRSRARRGDRRRPGRVPYWAGDAEERYVSQRRLASG